MQCLHSDDSSDALLKTEETFIFNQLIPTIDKEGYQLTQRSRRKAARHRLHGSLTGRDSSSILYVSQFTLERGTGSALKLSGGACQLPRSFVTNRPKAAIIAVATRSCMWRQHGVGRKHLWHILRCKAKHGSLNNIFCDLCAEPGPEDFNLGDCGEGLYLISVD